MSAAETETNAPGKCWQRRPELPFQVVADDVLVVDPSTRAVHLFNQTAARIWMLLSTPRSLDDLVAALSDEYDANLAELRTEVASFIADLDRKGLCAGPDVPPPAK
ncbi:MAG TPA: PqqD family protein [Polyangia bacterium]